MTGNSLLDAVGGVELESLLELARPVMFEKGDLLIEAGAPVHSVYFPTSGLLSLTMGLENGHSVETSAIGREGGAGLLEAASGSVMFARVTVQIPGEGWRIEANAYRRAHQESEAIRKVASLYAGLLLSEARQEIACNRLHTTDQRLVRWLLSCVEKTGAFELNLSQDFLAGILGTQRTTINASALALKNAGVISYSRGRIRVTDPVGLEERACECHAAIQSMRRGVGLLRAHQHAKREELAAPDARSLQ